MYLKREYAIQKHAQWCRRITMKKLAATTFAAVVLIGIGQGDQAEASNGQKTYATGI
ncbi:hypothetical protein JCM19045_2840 [Bacillus sp. JCM 19045]|nr:hypothetical protein JCM19045_2840 [Bacillus sp. JCM 19045]